jgi:hypothetical protein
MEHKSENKMYGLWDKWLGDSPLNIVFNYMIKYPEEFIYPMNSGK